MRNSSSRKLAALFLALVFLAACAPFSVPEENALSVVATIFAPYDLVRAVGGDAVTLRMLIPPASEAHSFEPTPADIIAVQRCDVFICVGGENEAWADEILASMDTSGKTVLRLLDMVETVAEERVEGMQSDDADGSEPDQHVWTNPQNAIEIVGQIREALCAVDAENADAYSENAAAYIDELARLDAGFREVADGAARRVIVFGDRYPFRYFSDEYNLEYYAAFPGCSSEAEPSARTVAFLIDTVRDGKIPVVYHAEMSNGATCEMISEATGAKVLELHACHNISADDFKAGVTMVELMRKNIDALREGLN